MKTLPALVDALLGTPHREMDCWQLVQYLFQVGRGLPLDPLPELNRYRVQEVWWRDATAPLVEVIHPWDILVFAVRGPLADHAGVVLDTKWFVHSREPMGVCKAQIAVWEKRCLQVVRVVL